MVLCSVGGKSSPGGQRNKPGLLWHALDVSGVVGVLHLLLPIVHQLQFESSCGIFDFCLLVLVASMHESKHLIWPLLSISEANK